MFFEWDGKKAASNLRKHGISFDEAVTVLYDPLAATFEDSDHSQEENRFISVGYSAKGRLVVISHAEENDVTRIISARRATRGERKRHEDEALGTAG